MIFSGSNRGITHIGMILMGVPEFRAKVDFGGETPIIKTQTRRWSRKVSVPELYQRYKIGRLYAIQPARTKPGLEGIKIQLTRKWIETWDLHSTNWHLLNRQMLANVGIVRKLPISAEDAWAEGGYTIEEYETTFRQLNPKWSGIDRVGLEFEVVKLV